MKGFKKALVLCLISGICALLIALVNYVTSPIIEENKIKRENESLALIYPDCSFTKLDNDNETINSIWIVEEGGETTHYIYSISGKNAYGKVTVLFGINMDGTIQKVILTENTESYSSKLDSHVEENYSTPVSDIDSIDLACGATFGAKLVKELVEIGLNDFYERLGQ